MMVTNIFVAFVVLVLALGPASWLAPAAAAEEQVVRIDGLVQ